MAAVMRQERSILFFFDIDNTLINFEASVKASSVQWTGGSVILWQRLCLALKILGERHGFKAKFGICSSKPKIDSFVQAIIGQLPAATDVGLSEFLFEKNETKEINDLFQQATRFVYDYNKLQMVKTRRNSVVSLLLSTKKSRKNIDLNKHLPIPANLDQDIEINCLKIQRTIPLLKKFRIYLTSGAPKVGALLHAANLGKIDIKDIWLIDDRKEECVEAKKIGCIAHHANIIHVDKAVEEDNVTKLINQILTMANNNIPITLNELVPECIRKSELESETKEQEELVITETEAQISEQPSKKLRR